MTKDRADVMDLLLKLLDACFEHIAEVGYDPDELLHSTVEEILAIPEIAIVDREVELPEFTPPIHIGKGTVVYEVAQA